MQFKDMMSRYHTHNLRPNQCSSSMVKRINAPLALVWAFVRQFNDPQAYKQFVKSCTMRAGDGGVGSVREVMVVSGLPAKISLERLDKLDDELHVITFTMIGGDHRLVNYQSTTTVHEDDEAAEKGCGGGGGTKTVVIESYVVDVPVGSSKEDTCAFADTIIGCNLRSLARISEKKARKA